MRKSTFIGMGKNPDGPDLPLGLGMRLAQDPKAFDSFAKMTNEEKSTLINNIQGAATGDDAKRRMADAVTMLHDRQG